METILFFNAEFNNYLTTLEKNIRDYVNLWTNKQFMDLDYEQMKDDVTKRYIKNPITIQSKNKEILKKPGGRIKGPVNNFHFDEEYQGYIFILTFHCKGHHEFLKYKPTEYLNKEYYLHDPTSLLVGIVQIKIYVHTLDKKDFSFKEGQVTKYLETNLKNLNVDIEKANTQVISHFNKYYWEKRKIVEIEEDFFREVEININKETDLLLNTTPIQIKLSPKPIEEKKSLKTGFYIPVVSETFYHDIIKVINLFYKSVEKKPSIYNSKDEEALRDYILPILELRYENTSITAETFNKKGKTDILIKHNDNTILFVAECKIWKGQSELKKAIDQLFGYITIRETKAALIVFVKKISNFSEIIAKIRSTLEGMFNYVETLEAQSETSISYRFHLPLDSGQKISLTIMVFYFE